MSLMVLTRTQAFRSNCTVRAPSAARLRVHRPAQYTAAPTIHHTESVRSGPSPRDRRWRRRKDEGPHDNQIPLSATGTMVSNGSSTGPTVGDDQGQDEQSAGQMLFEVSDLVLELLVYSDWPTLMAVARTNSTARGCVQFEVRIRVRKLVKLFICNDDLDQFFDEIDKRNVLIAGSTIRNLFYMNLTWWNTLLSLDEAASNPLHRPKDLNLILPAGQREGMTCILNKMGYGAWTIEYSSLHYEGVLKTITRGFRMGPLPQPASITLSESSTNSPLPVLLASPLTCQLNVASATKVYSFFPSLVSVPVALRTDYTHSSVCRHSYAHIQTQTDNRGMTSPCGTHCPARVRKTVRDPITASFRWNGGGGVRKGSVDECMAKELIVWRFSVFCRNSYCEHYVPYYRRR
ncbi:hypothetical protein BKA70DRAFT_1444498 [Coprinopsis sp. MPI-PUGE-AT-0042]|nr:hypothetical protein BKA70DRAFT_1444498 [Coprinopsis sp. MPI-PUGE-AT-0042]